MRNHRLRAIGFRLRRPGVTLAGPVILGALFVPLEPATVAQPSEIRGTITAEGRTRIPIALAPVAFAPSGVLGPVAAEIYQTLADDLSYSGYFEIVDASRAAGLKPPGPDGGDAKLWGSTGAQAVLASRVDPQDGQIALEGRLFDTQSAEMVLGKRYASQKDLVRRVAHRLASDVTAHFTGQPGVSLSRIAFVSQHGAGKELYVMDYDGQRVRRMTTTGTINLSPAWSPDGTRLAFLSFRRKFPAIYILEADGSITRLPTGGGDPIAPASAAAGAQPLPRAGGDLNSSPDWSPDGKRIAYASTRDGNCEIYVMDLSTGRERRLTQNEGIDSSPSWSPTGREIAFTSDRGGAPQIYIMDSEGGSARRLTFEGTRNDSPAWSPKGDRIAYVSRVEGKFALTLLDLGTQKASKILSGPFNCEDPRWSADARHLTFASDKEVRFNIYTIDADGSNVKRLTRGEASFTPDWSK